MKTLKQIQYWGPILLSPILVIVEDPDWLMSIMFLYVAVLLTVGYPGFISFFITKEQDDKVSED